MPTANELEAALRRDVIGVWFPRSLDHEYGGFLCDFDYRWNPDGPNEKLLESQARHTWFAAEATRFYPSDNHLHQAMEHGFSYLHNTLWDQTEGGWFHRVDRAGKPIAEYTKHTHGSAYAVLACVAVYETTGSKTALDLAQRGFEWIFRHAHDERYGGYHGYLRRDGIVIRSPDITTRWTDTIGAPLNCKDISVHSALLDTFTQLNRYWPEAKVADQLAEIIDIICKRMSTPLGAHHQYCLPDWTPVPHLTRFGHQFYDAFRLLSAARLFGETDEIVGAARSFVDHAIRYGWDHRHGGFYYAAPSIEPLSLVGHDLKVGQKQWWVQMGALQALLGMHVIAPDEPRYLGYFREQWRYVQNHFLDSLHRGVHTSSSEDLPWWQRQVLWLAPASITRKGSIWKDSSHDGRALLYCTSVLQKGFRVDAKTHHSPRRQRTVDIVPRRKLDSDPFRAEGMT
jgi:mannobiose 2-epimerase